MTVITDKEKINAVLTRGVEAVLPTREKLAEQLASGVRLRLYCGFDPTAPFLHLGHAIQLRKLRQFQDLGHEVICLFGTFTAMIGDPTDKLAARKQLTRDEVMANAKNWKKYFRKFLRFTGENKAVMMYNHKWLGKMTFEDVVKLASNFTVQQMLERDMFAKRMAEQKPIHVHEFMYPLMQGYDSVAMDVDIEVGGNDQTFNMLAGRTLQRTLKNREKSVVALKLLTNDEGKKMSKSEGGFIAIDDSPEEMYGKIMAMADSVIVPYFEVVTDVPMEEIAKMREQLASGANPRDIKMKLAKTVVGMFHNAAAAKRAEKHFVSVFQKKETPNEMIALTTVGASVALLDAVARAFNLSRSEARRQIEQGGVSVDEKQEKNLMATVNVGSVIQWGKRHFARVTKE